MAAPTQFGALTLPAPAPDVDEAGGDPSLDTLLAFARAVIVARCGTLWSSIAPASTSVVQVTRAHDPGELVVTEKQFPGLWAWRTRGDFERIADDFDTEAAALSLLWIFPPAQQNNQRVRTPTVNAVGKALCAALARGRDPAWVATADPEAQAARNGSFLWKQAGWFAFEKVSWKLQDLVIDKGGEQATYPGVQWEIAVRELVHLGHPPDPNALTTTLEIPDGDAPLVTFALPL